MGLTWPKNPKIDDTVAAINSLDVRISAIETRLAATETGLAALGKRIGALETRAAATDKQVATIESTANSHKVRLDDLDQFKADHSAGAVERQREVDLLRSGADRLRWAVSHGRRP